MKTSKKLIISALLMLSLCSSANASDGVVILYGGQSSSGVTVPAGGSLTFTPEGVKVSPSGTVTAFSSFGSILLSADRSAISTVGGSSGTPSQPRTSATITVPATYQAVKVTGAAEPETFDLSGASITITGSYTYSGSAVIPAFTVTYGTNTLQQGTDYSATVTDNVNAGIATVTITALGSTYTGSKSAKFFIDRAPIAGAVLSLAADSYEYTGSAIEPPLSVSLGQTVLIPGTDYTVEYSGNTEPGTAAVTVTGKGNYTGTATKQFEIVQTAVKTVDFSVVINTIQINDPAEDGDTKIYAGTHGTVFLTGTGGQEGDTVTVEIRPDSGYELIEKNFRCMHVNGVAMTMLDTMKTSTADGVFTTKILVPADGNVFVMVEFIEKVVSGIGTAASGGDGIILVYDARGVLVAACRRQEGYAVEEMLAPLADGLYIIKENNKTYKIYKR